MPKISIIIPTYNSAETIRPCLDSIVAQTFQDKEVVIIDGVSSDSTAAIVNEYMKHFPYIKWISERDNGIYDAMNKGIEIAKGEWLYFLGSDDTLYSSDTLEKVAAEMKSTTAEVIYGNITSERFGGVYAGEFSKQKLSEQNICHQAIFFKKSVFFKTGLFDLKYKAHADYDHNLKWFLSDKISHQFIDIIVANYADGGMSSQMGDYVFQRIKNWKYSFLIRKDMTLINKIKVLREELLSAVKEKRKEDFYTICKQSVVFLLGI